MKQLLLEIRTCRLQPCSLDAFRQA